MSRPIIVSIFLLAFASFVAGCGKEQPAPPVVKSEKSTPIQAAPNVGDSDSNAAKSATGAPQKLADPTQAAPIPSEVPSATGTDSGGGDESQSLIAWDEFDGVNRGGWKEPGLGVWGKIGKERDGALVVAGDAVEARELARPVKTGVVWYAVTFRMGTKITGSANVVPSADGKKLYSPLGFSAKTRPFSSRGFWMNSGWDTRIENTELQTMLTWYNFEFGEATGYAAKDFGLALLGEGNIVTRRPRFRAEGTFRARRMTHLIISKEGKEELIIERVAIARSLEDALNPPHLAEQRKKEASAASSKSAASAESQESESGSPATDSPQIEPDRSDAVSAPRP